MDGFQGSKYWFKPHLYNGINRWFPVDFPLNQSIDAKVNQDFGEWKTGDIDNLSIDSSGLYPPWIWKKSEAPLTPNSLDDDQPLDLWLGLKGLTGYL